MLRKRTGFPEESEIILCTVTNVQHHSVFVKLDEFGVTGMIHISEVSPGRIRNIRDFVKEGKVIVCKILRINKERGHIDLSLRRVTESQRRRKINQAKQEQKSEKIIEIVAKKLGKKPEELYALIFEKLSKQYESLFDAFMAVVNGELDLNTVQLPDNVANELREVITTRVKPAEVSLQGDLILSTSLPKGVELVKEALVKSKKAGAKVNYLKAGVYRLTITAGDYKTAEKLLKNTSEAALQHMSKHGQAEFTKLEK